MMRFEPRLEKLRDSMGVRGLNGLLVLRPENRRYLSGFTGSAGALLIDSGRALLLTDFRYLDQAQLESPHFEVVRVEKTIPETLALLLQGQQSYRLGLEGDYITHQQYTAFDEKLAGVSIESAPGLVEQLRQIKDIAEIEVIEQAAALADRAFRHIRPMLRPGARERDIALELEFFMRRAGADGASFPIIAASGPRSALPHGVASDRVLAPGDFLTLDFGAIMQGYNSDMTRTVVLGRPTPRHREIYNIVLEAQQAALEYIRPGVAAAGVDRAARSIIEGYGYGEYFGHSTGHGLGLAVHESPRLAATDQTVLQEGMVVTAEPGIYLPNWGGVRIEDMVLVAEGGCRVLTKSPKIKMITL